MRNGRLFDSLKNDKKNPRHDYIMQRKDACGTVKNLNIFLKLGFKNNVLSFRCVRMNTAAD